MNSRQASSSGNWALNCLSVYFFMAPYYRNIYVLSRDNHH